MSKAIEGAAILGGAVVLGAFTLGAGGVALEAIANTVLAGHILTALVVGGLAMEAGAIAGALTSNRGTSITTRQAAAFRQVIYGEQRVGGVMVYESTTGGKHDQYNYVIVLAGHPCESIVNLYLDGRKVFWTANNIDGNQTFPDGTNFGGAAAHGDHIGPGGQHYDFGTLVYCEAYMGLQTSAPNTTPGGGFSTGLQANDPAWAPSAGGTPYLGGCTYVYLKVEYDTNMFPSAPEIQFTVRGKNNILDPRTGAAGYTHNWALIVSDVLQDTQFGLGDVGNVNTAQLIAAANVCDEQVALAAGGTESRYSCHWHYDTGTDPGNGLATMMPAAAGRLSQIGGEWYIWPAYWQGPSFTFNANALTGPISWNPNRSLRDLYNCVNGTYIAANFPYNNAGNLYDSNGWFDGTLDNTFPFGFKSTNYPQVACDVRHGFAANQYLTDDGKMLPFELTQSCVLSVAQAQRVGFIYLQRNRQQGSGSFPMNLAAWEMQPTDVMSFTFEDMGWSEKVLEIVSTTLKIDVEDDAPVVRLSCGVQETAATVYEWSTAQELTVYDVPANPAQAPYTPAPPTNITLISGAATALIGADGIVRPRVEVQWTVPLDILVKQVQTQYQRVSPLGAWIDAGLVDVGNTLTYVDNVVAGQQYNFRIRSLRANGAASVWEEIDGYTVSITLSIIGQLALAPGTLVAEAYSDGTAGITVEGFTAVYGALSVAVLTGSSITLPGLNQGELYFVYYIDPTFAGGNIAPIATQDQDDYLDHVGYFLIDSIVTPTYTTGGTGGTMGGGGKFQPSSYSDIGSRTTLSPAAAYDSNISTAATVSATCSPMSNAYTIGQCVWQGFLPEAVTAALTLHVKATVTGASDESIPCDITAQIAGATTTLFSSTASAAAADYTASVPAGTELSSISVTALVSGDASADIDVPRPKAGVFRAVIAITDIYVQ